MAKRCHSLICQRPARYLTLNEGQQKHQLGKVLKSRYYCERNVFFFLMVKVVMSLLVYIIANIQERVVNTK